jgi:hypothetical protein
MIPYSIVIASVVGLSLSMCKTRLLGHEGRNTNGTLEQSFLPQLELVLGGRQCCFMDADGSF